MNNETLLNNLEEIIGKEALNAFVTIKGIKKGAYINVHPDMEERLDNLLEEKGVFYKKIRTKWRTENTIYPYIAYFISKTQNPNKWFRNNVNMTSGSFDQLVGFFLGFEAVYDLTKNQPCSKGWVISIKAFENGNRMGNIFSSSYEQNLEKIRNYSILDFCWIGDFEKIKEKMLKIRQQYDLELQKYFPNRFFIKLYITKS